MIDKMPSPEHRQQEQAMNLMGPLFEKMLENPDLLKELIKHN